MLPFLTDELTLIIPKPIPHHANFSPDLRTPSPRKPSTAPKKVRHSKIDTAHGTRDRRMRLSLEVARKFFNLQDTLGFDKASKTIEWLLSKSSSAIDELSSQSNKNPSPRKIQIRRESRVRARERAKKRVRCRREETLGRNKNPNSEETFTDEILGCSTQERLLRSDDSNLFMMMNPNINYSNCVESLEWNDFGLI